jgi:hypothetical protein
LQKVSVGASNQVLETVGGFSLDHTERDGVLGVDRCHRPVHVDECGHESGAGSMRTLQLARHLQAELARPRAREYISRREFQRISGLDPVLARLGAVAGCLLPVMILICGRLVAIRPPLIVTLAA